ncbi:TIGR00159 family protein [bacterium]|nr:TIGR00159 family protein [bacterium]
MRAPGRAPAPSTRDPAGEPVLRELLSIFDDWRYPVEVLILFLLVFGLLSFLRGTRGEGILKGLGAFLIFSFVGLLGLARVFNLERLEFLLDSIFKTSVIALVVIFQPELRRGLVKIVQLPFAESLVESRVVEEVASAAVRLAKLKVGALIALERQQGLKAFTENAVRLDAEVKAELLFIVFFPGSPLHDGAVVIQKGRIAAAGCLFPLTDNPEVSKSLGTRHRAGIGVSEETDAVVVICSEETGTISVAEGGRLHRDLDKEQLQDLLRRLYLQEEVAAPAHEGDTKTAIPLEGPPTTITVDRRNAHPTNERAATHAAEPDVPGTRTAALGPSTVTRAEEKP